MEWQTSSSAVALWDTQHDIEGSYKSRYLVLEAMPQALIAPKQTRTFATPHGIAPRVTRDAHPSPYKHHFPGLAILARAQLQQIDPAWKLVAG